MLESLEPRTLASVTLLPDLPNAPRPSLEPALPGAFDAFAPPVAAQSLAPQAPVIAEYTRTAGPDESIALSATQLTTTADPSGPDTAFFTFAQSPTAPAGALTAAAIQTVRGPKAAVTLDASLPAHTMYLLWAANAAGVSAPVAVNKTESWWLGPTATAAPGQSVSLFGRNLSLDPDHPQAWIYLKAPGNVPGQWAQVTAVNPYKVDFVLPATLAPGTYEVWAHNGHGGHYGWASPLSLTVAAPADPWTGPTLNVQAFGATGDGVTDDTAALNAAFEAALAAYYRGQGNPTLYFPAGTYRISQTLRAPVNTRWQGAGRDATVLVFRPPAGGGPLNNLLYNTDYASVRAFADLSFDGADGALSPTALYGALGLPNTGQLLFQRVGVTTANLSGPGGAEAFHLVGAQRAQVEDCRFVGGGVGLENARQVFIARCSFQGSNDASGIVLGRCQEVAITGCSMANLDATSVYGWSGGRFIAGGGGQMGASFANWYLADNTTTGLSVRPGVADQNAGEQILLEAGATFACGTPLAASATSVSLAGIPTWTSPLGASVYVTAGPGVGQQRRVVGYDPARGTLSLDAPWAVLPTAASTVGLGTTADHLVIYRNRLQGAADYATRVTASAGVELYGNAYNTITDSNTITQVRTALSLWAILAGPVNLSPSSFNVLVNNTVGQALVGVLLQSWWANAPVPSLVGNLVRGNRIADLSPGPARGELTPAAFLFNGSRAPTGLPMDFTILEHNTGVNLPRAAAWTAPADPTTYADTVLYHNSFDAGNQAAGSQALVFAPSQGMRLLGNSWQNFATIYDGSPPGAMLETSLHGITVRASLGSKAKPSVVLGVRDVGTSALTWSATDNVRWASVSGSKTAAPESSTSLIITFNPPAKAGTYTGTLTITAGNITRKCLLTLIVQ